MGTIAFFSFLIALAAFLAVWPWTCFISTVVFVCSFAEYVHQQAEDLNKKGGSMPWWWGGL